MPSAPPLVRPGSGIGATRVAGLTRPSQDQPSEQQGGERSREFPGSGWHPAVRARPHRRRGLKKEAEGLGRAPGLRPAAFDRFSGREDPRSSTFISGERPDGRSRQVLGRGRGSRPQNRMPPDRVQPSGLKSLGQAFPEVRSPDRMRRAGVRQMAREQLLNGERGLRKASPGSSRQSVKQPGDPGRREIGRPPGFEETAVGIDLPQSPEGILRRAGRPCSPDVSRMVGPAHPESLHSRDGELTSRRIPSPLPGRATDPFGRKTGISIRRGRVEAGRDMVEQEVGPDSRELFAGSRLAGGAEHAPKEALSS